MLLINFICSTCVRNFPGAVQPTRAAWLAQYAPGQGYHFNAVQAWGVSPDGKIANVFA